MFHVQTLDVYKCAIGFLPIGYAHSKLVDGEIGKDERRFLVTARGSALECAAVLDAQAVGVVDPRLVDGYTLLVRIVSMLTKVIG